MNKVHDATRAQIQAANPEMSTWVTANAGSGKTRVLTDRVARLLLTGVPPERILCLTYTKAAASHMQNQLFTRLGGWAMLKDTGLQAQLSLLGVAPADFTPDYLRNARTLFARALETPGGLKIQTIHSFCASLLRRFPLEAGVSPNFQELDERSIRLLHEDILERIADGPEQAAFDGLAAHVSGDDLGGICMEVAKNREHFARNFDQAGIWASFGLPPHYREADYLATVFPDWIADVLPDLATALLTGSTNDKKGARKLAKIPWHDPDVRAAAALESLFVFDHTTKIQPNEAKIPGFPTKSVRESHPDLIEALDALMRLFAQQKPNRQALVAAQKTLAIHRFAHTFLAEYDETKQQHGWLDFDDLIAAARALLTERSMAQWVLFKLDGGIDHILVDEAQDTSPGQWDIIARLADEFFVGAGARDVARTVFVVGDEKQSIYSFQGADPAAFDRMRGHFQQRLHDSADHLNQRSLRYSFRSSPAILRYVDAVVKSTGDPRLADSLHHSYQPELPGRVDLWPFLEKPGAPENPPWHQTGFPDQPDDPNRELANRIAHTIAGMIRAKSIIPTKDGPRVVRAGDFLILVRSRSDLFFKIIGSLKAQDLAVAGADRLKVAAELAVMDLTALLGFMATPEDDLSLAAVLRSPIFGLTEQDIFALAHDRKGHLWPSLRERQAEYPQVVEILLDLLRVTDFLRPYELLERILTRHHGRTNLIARLGYEAEDGINAFLHQALQYEQVEAPGLTGFLSWIAADESEVKREMDTEATEIRVMTIHGAKGLESPIVILPQTGSGNTPTESGILPLENGITAWTPKSNDCPAILRQALERRRALLDAERLRLLYVAMSRTETWLIICGAGKKAKDGRTWYQYCEAGLEITGSDAIRFHDQEIRRFQPLTWPDIPVDASASMPKSQADLPDWATRPAPTAHVPPAPISPSDLGEGIENAGPGDTGDPGAAKLWGQRVHVLLEHLPAIPPERWQDAAAQILSRRGEPVTRVEIDALLLEITPILQDPDLAFLFAPRTLAEIAVTANIGHRPLVGRIDRLVVDDHRVLVVDFKSGSVVPASAGQTPEPVLRQMGAYRAALEQIYPHHTIETAILWTKTGELVRLPHEIVTAALNRASTS